MAMPRPTSNMKSDYPKDGSSSKKSPTSSTSPLLSKPNK